MGGSFAVVWVATFRWNGWQVSVEYAVNASLLKNYNLGMKNAVYHESVRWLIKALAQSGNTKYRSTLEEVTEKAKSRRIARYAKKHLQKLL